MNYCCDAKKRKEREVGDVKGGTGTGRGYNKLGDSGGIG